MMIVWSILYGFGTNYYVQQKYMDINNINIIAGLSVFSHFVLDFVVHNDDMRIIPTSDTSFPTLYLWEYPTVTFILEFVIIIGSWEYYLKGLKTSQGSDFSRKRPLILLGLLSLLHIVFYLPSFSDDAEGSDADSMLGVSVMILILGIAALMAWAHPPKPTISQT